MDAGRGRRRLALLRRLGRLCGLGLLLAVLVVPIRAEAQGYVVSIAPAPYAPIGSIAGITGVLAVTFADPDEAYAVPVNLPFSFNFLGAAYTQVGLSTNGWMGFGATVRPPDFMNVPIPSAQDPSAFIAGFWCDLDVTGGSAAHGVIGAAPSRIFVLELAHVGVHNGDPADDLSMQFWLFEGQQRFEIHYGGSLSTTGITATAGFDGVGGSPYGALSACGGTAQCSATDYAQISGHIFRVDRSVVPELTGSVGAFPRGALPGGSARGMVSIQNWGIRTATSVQSNLYLSADTALDPSDILIGTLTAPSVGGGATVTLSVTATVPLGTAPVDDYILLFVDAPNQWHEPDETNNVSHSVQRFATAYDLAPTAVAPVGTAGGNAGDTLSFTLTIQNAGVLYRGPVGVTILASANRIYDVGDPQLAHATVNMSGLALETFTVQGVVPQLAPGHDYPIALVDDPNRILEYDETNNELAGTTSFPTGPDFAIGAVTAPASVAPGAPVAITTRILSSGVPYHGSVTYALYASPTQSLGASPAQLASFTVALSGQASVDDARTVAFDAAIAPGLYYIVAVVDPQNAIAETNEANNTGSTSMRVVDGPDLAFGADITATPAELQVGAQLEVQTTIVSGGSAFVGQVPYRIYLSPQSTPGPSDVPIDDGLVAINGAMTTLDARFALPRAVPAGDSYVTVIIDPDGTIREADKTNNTATSIDPITVDGGDIKVDAISGRPIAFIGLPYAIDLDVENAGPVTSYGFRYAYYLSDDDIIDESDAQIFLSGTATLAQGQRLRFTDRVTIPTLTSSATKFVGAILIPSTPDPDVGNNAGRIAGPVHIVFPIPELSGAIVESATVAAAGEPFWVTRALDNTGVADAPDFTYAYYLSSDAAIDARDILLGTFHQGLAIGAEDIRIDRLTIPSTTPAGTYFLGLIVNSDGRVPEIDPTNDVALGPRITVYAGALRFLTTSLPDATLGARYQATITAAGGPLIPRYQIASGALPAGLSLDGSSGLIFGVPTSEGTFGFNVDAVEGSARIEQAFTLRVLAPTITLDIATTSLQAAITGEDYRAALVAIGGIPPYAWSASSDLPDGLSLSSAGVISGRASYSGAYAIAVHVQDGAGATKDKSIALNVVDAARTVRIVQAALPSGVVGAPYCTSSTVSFTAIGGVGPYLWSLLVRPPPGLALSSAGALCGTPQLAGSFGLLVRAEDQVGLFDTSLFMLEVDGGTDFAFSTSSLPTTSVGQPYSARIEAIRGDEPYQFTLLMDEGSLPPGIALDPTGALSGAATMSGVFAFAVEVTDAKLRTKIQPLSIAVDPRFVGKKSGGCGCSSTKSAPFGGHLVLVFLGLLLSVRSRRMAAMLAFALVLSPAIARAQLVAGTPYTRVAGPITYRSLLQPTVLHFSDNDDGNVTVPLPFPFSFYGTGTAAITVGINGAVLLQGGGMVSFSNAAPGAGAPPWLIAPFWDDLLLRPDATHAISTELDGVIGIRTFTIEYRNVSQSGSSIALNFQIRFHEAPGGRFDVDYGPTSGAATFSAVMGADDTQAMRPILFAASACTDTCALSDVAALGNSRLSYLVDRGIDLAAAGVDAPAFAYAGSSFMVAAAVSNVHGASIGPFNVQLFLAADRSATRGTVVASSTITLAAYEERALSLSALAPSSLSPGDDFLGLSVDPRHRVSDVDTANNVILSATPIHLLAGKPDLTVVGVVSGSSSVAAGGSVAITSSVANVGGLAVSAAPFAVALSTNPLITGADLILASFTEDLAPGAAVTDVRRVMVPQGVASGVYYIGTVADPANTLDEISKLNNGRAARTPLVVHGANLAIATSTLPFAVIGRDYAAYLAPISGGPTFSWRISQGSLPPGLMLDAPSGLVHGTAQSTGTSTFTVELSSAGRTASKDFTLAVVEPSEPLTIVTRHLPYAIAGDEYAFQLEATRGTGTGTLTWTGSGLPDGLLLSTGGLISGTSQLAGTTTVSVAVFSGGEMSGKALVLVVRPSGSLAIIPEPLPHAALLQPYRHQLQAQGGSGAISWGVDVGALPEGLALGSDGLIAGAPLKVGSFSFVVSAKDSGAGLELASDSATLVLIVDDAGSPFDITTTSLPDAYAGSGYDQSIHAAGGTLPLVWTIEAGTLPDGLIARLDPATGDFRIAGQPTTLGTSNMIVGVTDIMGRHAARALAIRVLTSVPVASPSSSKSCGCSSTNRARTEGASIIALLSLLTVRSRSARRSRPAPDS
jgi:hypothetical protein